MKFLRQTILFIIIVLLHAVLILGPVGCYWLKKDEKKQKEIAFKVELGGLEPSHAPEVGPPERTRPTGVPPEEAPAPEPPAPEPPAPEPPAPKPQPKPQPKPKPKPQPKPQPKPKPKPQPKPKPKTDPKKEAERKQREKQKRIREIREANRRQEAAKKRAEAERRRKLEQGVYRPRGGSNFNPNVRIGDRNTGQRYGKQDNKTPAGGASKATEAEWRKFDEEMNNIIFRMWVPPAGIWVDDETSAVIAVSVDPRGKITAKKIIKRSPNAAVNASVEKLIRDLDKAPIPPRGEATGWVQITLKQTN